MAWQDEMVEILRVMVSDMGVIQTYSDDNLERVLVVAAFQVGREVPFPVTYKADASNTDIKPDPTDTVNGTRDESFVNLTCLKAACMLDRGAALIAAKQAISVKDGSSAIDLRDVAKVRLALLEKGGFCAAYEEAKLDYRIYGLVAGAAVMTPFRLYAFGGYYRGDNAFYSGRMRPSTLY